MQITRKVFFAGPCRCRPDGWRGRRRRLSVASDPADRALRAGRRRRRHRAHHRQARQRDHWADDRDRKPRRRRRSILGTEAVKNAPIPTAYTLLVGQSGPISINPAVYENLRFDPVRDFAPVTMTTASSLHPGDQHGRLPAENLQEFISAGQEQTGARSTSPAASISAANHLVAGLFQQPRRIEDDAHSLSRHGARGRRSARQPGDDGVRRRPVTALLHIQASTLNARAVSNRGGAPRSRRMSRPSRKAVMSGFDAISWLGILAP